MNKVAHIVSLAMMLAGAGCHDLERSRQVDNPAVRGKTIALQVCSNCHGATGVSVSPMFPKLAGQRKEYLVDQLTDFKSHARADPNAKRYMWGFTHLTDKQIDELADYFSSQAAVPGEAVDRTVLDAGRAIFVGGLPDKGVAACVGCHGQHGEGMSRFPRLAGQHADYVIKQLRIFRETDSRPRGAIMKSVCANMTEQDMRAVAAYVEAFPAEAGVPVSPPKAGVSVGSAETGVSVGPAETGVSVGPAETGASASPAEPGASMNPPEAGAPTNSPETGTSAGPPAEQ
ncbi:c-type cytochrome [Burkholderia diffusa]|uniref:c-type cytochrome n=1 Tax=Burkholderia diffusa TaxID=488732 RepID=UPI002654A005|nr:c-type cytochrome [Burkholderia diffusa]MDN7904565.1 c-type cytochrome [Burkholderia diffusa]